MVVVVVCRCCGQFPPVVSTNFHQFSSRTPKFSLRTTISVRGRDVYARQRSLCAAEISSVRSRDLCARQRTPLLAAGDLCARQTSLWAAEERARQSGPVWTRSTRTTREVWAGKLGNFVFDLNTMILEYYNVLSIAYSNIITFEYDDT